MSENDASRIIIDDSRVMLQIVASLTDDSRGVIYNRNVFYSRGHKSELTASFYQVPNLNLTLLLFNFTQVKFV